MWKSTEQKIHNIWRSVKFLQNEHTPDCFFMKFPLTFQVYSVAEEDRNHKGAGGWQSRQVGSDWAPPQLPHPPSLVLPRRFHWPQITQSKMAQKALKLILYSMKTCSGMIYSQDLGWTLWTVSNRKFAMELNFWSARMSQVRCPSWLHRLLHLSIVKPPVIGGHLIALNRLQLTDFFECYNREPV